MDLDDLADKSLIAYTNHVEHVGVTHSFSDNQRPCHLLYHSLTHFDNHLLS